MSPRLFTIPASAPFLPTLIAALRAGTLVPGFPASGDPLELARLTLYLPTRRACRLARDEFLRALDTDAAILPRIVALGDLDEDEIAFAEAATGDLAQAALALPPAIAPLERRLLLAELISKWAVSRAVRGSQGASLVANTPASALALADELARLMDDMTTRGIGWDKLDTLVRDTHEHLDKYWQLSLEFLTIAREKWPQYLAEKRLEEPAARRDKLIEAEEKRLMKSTAPVIAAGSTGSMPATAKLLATIARLPHGALVLPGLDLSLDEESWRLIAGDGEAKTHDGEPAAGHPQFAMQALLARIGVTRKAVTTLGQPQGREALASEALRPAATTHRWQERTTAADFAGIADAATASLAMIEAGNAEEEALAIAVALRESTEAQKTAALVTPDRALARRVLAALERWNVNVDDSGGDRLADTPAGVFARLAAEAALGGLEPVTLLALLKHPLLRLAAAQGAHDRAVSALERAVLRGPRPKPHTAGLAHALTTYWKTREKLHHNDPRKLVSPTDFAAAQALTQALAAALKPLETLQPGRHTLASLAALHRDVVAALSDVAFDGADGTRLAQAFEELIASQAAAGMEIAIGDYAEMVEGLTATGSVRMREQPNVRIRILGPLEARLQSFDRVVLAGLNEGTWPPDMRSDPWLSRPMRKQLGLNLPELRVGLTAHDFAQALGAPDAIITRAAKVAGAPTVRSRFVQRLAAVAGKERWVSVVARGANYLALARRLDEPDRVVAAPRPTPSPPLDVRPNKLSVTAIEDWLRDPYTIYARYVLNLHPLEAVDTEPGAADRGSIIHEAIGNFTKEYAGGLPADPEAELIAFGEKSFAPMRDFPEAKAFWWPRFKRIARWFAGWERERRATLASMHGEIQGTLTIPLGATTFTLTARADRIERRTDGSYAILDYKTGQPPTPPQVRAGLAPQLTLEATILRNGNFEGVAPGSVAALSYVRLKGGEPPGEENAIDFKDRTPDSFADYALLRLTGVAAKFLVGSEPYRSLVHPMWTRHYGDYDHLARVKEWAASGGESEYEEPPS